MNVMEAVLSVYPKAKDCVDGHIGAVYTVIEKELEDDRYYEVTVERCGWCDMPVGKVDYV